MYSNTPKGLSINYWARRHQEEGQIISIKTHLLGRPGGSRTAGREVEVAILREGVLSEPVRRIALKLLSQGLLVSPAPHPGLGLGGELAVEARASLLVVDDSALCLPAHTGLVQDGRLRTSLSPRVDQPGGGCTLTRRVPPTVARGTA